MAAAITVAASGAPLTGAVAQDDPVPAWLQAHVGVGDGQIARVVLERARALYWQKRGEGTVENPCYLAMDATRPSAGRNGAPGERFYVICEADGTFRAMSSGYGNGRKLERADFSNDRQCAKNFSNAEGSKLTAGGPYVTAETRTSFKGYILEEGEREPFFRTFLLFDGEGETENAREREIGGHRAAFVKWQCRFEDPDSPHADEEGYAIFGRLVDYTGGRSNGCTTWSEEATEEILGLVEGNPTTLYIYPESGDIEAVAEAVRTGSPLSGDGPYWNASCLKEIGTPKFWPKQTLEPIIDAWRDSLPTWEPQPMRICEDG